MKHLLLTTIAAVLSASAILVFGQEANTKTKLLNVLEDENALGTDFWIYNNLEAARAEAKRTNKPMFVTFRCVPCVDCKGFDAEVAKNNQRIVKLAQEAFIAVRQVEMKGVDLSQFQFDYDLNWAAMFLNADGTVYARYGTQSAKGADAYNSIESLEKTMRLVLALHKNYPANKSELSGKLGKPKPYKSALEMPGMKHRNKLAGSTTRNNCVHCHNIHDAEHQQLQALGPLAHDVLWRYPLPDNIGLHIDPTDGCIVKAVQPESPASKAGLLSGDVLTHADGQALTSIADLQWVLHNLPNTRTGVMLKAVRRNHNIDSKLAMPTNWKRTDISWRGSLWSIKPVLAVWCAPMKEERINELNLSEGVKPLEVRWINTGRPEGRNAKLAGLQQGDIIVAIEGKPLQMSSEHFNMYIKLKYEVGDNLPLTLLRKGRPMNFNWPLTDGG